MARLEYLDDFYGLRLRNEKRINMRHTLSTLTLRTILALQGLPLAPPCAAGGGEETEKRERRAPRAESY